SSAAQHSQSLEAWYVHIPGLVVIAPATPADNYGLLKAAIQCDDPVVYMEHKALWPMEGEVTLNSEPLPIGKANTVREGKDLTVVTWSAAVHTCTEAAQTLAEQGIDAEVIDLRTLWPWDQEAVLASAEKTGNVLVVHDAVRVGGFGAEIVATIAETMGGRVPVARLRAPRAPVPYALGLEQTMQTRAEHVVARAKQLLGR